MSNDPNNATPVPALIIPEGEGRINFANWNGVTSTNRELAERVEDAARHLTAQSVAAAPAPEISTELETRVQSLLAVLPEGQRAAGMAALLQHYDLRREEVGGQVTYSPDPNEAQPRAGTLSFAPTTTGTTHAAR